MCHSVLLGIYLLLILDIDIIVADSVAISVETGKLWTGVLQNIVKDEQELFSILFSVIGIHGDIEFSQHEILGSDKVVAH